MIILRLHYLKLIVPAIYTLSGKKNEGTLESLIEYSIIYTHFSYFFVCLFFFLQGLINLKNYDDRLYVKADDLAVWASDFSYMKWWSDGYWSPMTPSFIFLISFTFSHIFCWLSNFLKQAVWQQSEEKCGFLIFSHIFILLVLERRTIL